VAKKSSSRKGGGIASSIARTFGAIWRSFAKALLQLQRRGGNLIIGLAALHMPSSMALSVALPSLHHFFLVTLRSAFSAPHKIKPLRAVSLLALYFLSLVRLDSFT